MKDTDAILIIGTIIVILIFFLFAFASRKNIDSTESSMTATGEITAGFACTDIYKEDDADDSISSAQI